jgi:hypothetical protein
MSKVWMIVFEIHAVRKTQTASVPPPRPPFSSPGTKTEVKNKVSSAPSLTQPGFGFLCVFSSLREPSAPPRTATEGHATGTYYEKLLAPLLPRAGARGGGDEGGKSTELRFKLLAASQS